MSVHANTETIGEAEIIAQAQTALQDIAAIKGEIANVIFGQEDVIQNAIVSILSGGHALLVGVPGLAKTKLVDTLGTVLGQRPHPVHAGPDARRHSRLGSA